MRKTIRIQNDKNVLAKKKRFKFAVKPNIVFCMMRAKNKMIMRAQKYFVYKHRYGNDVESSLPHALDGNFYTRSLSRRCERAARYLMIHAAKPLPKHKNCIISCLSTAAVAAISIIVNARARAGGRHAAATANNQRRLAAAAAAATTTTTTKKKVRKHKFYKRERASERARTFALE